MKIHAWPRRMAWPMLMSPAAVAAGLALYATAAPAQQTTAGTELDTIEVRGQRIEASYRAERASTATKIDASPLELPLSIRGISEAVMRDQQALRITDAIENFSSARPSPSLGIGTGFILRGFRDSNATFRNGLRATAGTFRSEFDTTNLERVELLKGPASILYGRSEPGGLINLVTKRPQAEAAHSLDLQIGTDAFYRAQVDSTGPIDDAGRWLYRFAGSVQDSETFRDFSQLDRQVIAPSLSWKPGERTSVTVELEHTRQDYIADFGIPVIGDRPAPVPISRSFGDPNDTVDTIRRTTIATDVRHDFNERFTLNHRFLTTRNETQDDFVNPAPAFGNALRADGRTLDRNIFHQVTDGTIYATNLDLITRLVTGPARHEIVTGVDYLQGKSDYSIFGGFNAPDPALAIDIFDPGPSYGIPRSRFEEVRGQPILPNAYSKMLDRNLGFYVQDHIRIGDRWHLLAGLRYDRARTGRGRGPSFAEAQDSLSNGGVVRKDEEVSPRFGALYQLTQALGVYGSWSRSFGANNGIDAAGNPHAPQQGEQFEAGLKWAGADQRLVITTALFELTRSNMLTPDLSATEPGITIPVGEQRSRGFEIDVEGKLSENLSLIASYTHMESLVTRNNTTELRDKRLPDAPRNAATFFARYDAAWFPGLSMGGGLFAVSDRAGDLQNSFLLPGYARLDAFAAYRFIVAGRSATVQLNLRNVLDKDHYVSTDPSSNVSPRNGVYPGAPFTALTAFRIEL